MLTKKIRKAVIPAAGMGTRFLPATKAMPKEMLPIVNVPSIQLIVEEAVKSGIEEILIVVSSSKNSIIDHFDYSYELENRLKEKNKMAEYRMVRKIADIASIQYIRQKEPLGLGHAILCAKSFINNEPFAVLLGDDIVVNSGNQKTALQQCINAHNKTKDLIVGVQEVKHEDVSKYGIIDPASQKNGNIFKVNSVVEKPAIEKAPSNFAILGRYVLTPDIFEELEKVKKDKSGEIQLTDAILRVSKKKSVHACVFEGKRYDIGSKLGFVVATIDAALRDEEIGESTRKHIKEIQ